MDLERILEQLEYSRADGTFKWKIRKQGVTRGMVAGNVDVYGYRSVRVGGTVYKMHRIVWFIETGKCPEFIDHINGNKDDNRFENLRPAKKMENRWNSKKPITNTSGVKGVSWHKGTRRWIARIICNGRDYSQYFRKREDAESAVIGLREALHRDFANHG